MRSDNIGQALGWFSLGLGVAELLAGKPIGRFFGVPKRNAWIRACGAREIWNGIGLLGDSRNRNWFAGRIAGDVMDLSLLGAALRSRSARRDRIAGALAGVAVVTAIDALATPRPSAA